MYAVVQVRGVVKTRQDIKDTLKMLRLHHINHCVLIPDSPQNLGMIQKVKDYVAFGEVDAPTVETLPHSRSIDQLAGQRHTETTGGRIARGTDARYYRIR